MNDLKEKLKEKVEEIQIINDVPPLRFFNPLKDIHIARLPIAGCGWVETDEGVVLIDTLINRDDAKKVYEKVHQNHGQRGIIKYIIYTHRHLDHIGGTWAFLDDKPEIIASKYLIEGLEKYKMQAQHRNRIAAQQFALPERTIKNDMQKNIEYIYPTKTFLGDMSFTLGDKTFELHARRAETDDAVWVWIPELKTAFIGDLLIGSLPNIGNPWKPTRFALSWIKTLEEVREKNPEYLFFNGAGRMIKGKEVQKALDINIEGLRSLFDQLIDYINEGVHITEMIHKVKLPDHLKDSYYLDPTYSRIEFFVFNVYRWYHGYYDGNPANLIPRPQYESKRELLDIIGDPNKILKRSRKLKEKNKTQLALEVLDVLIQADPDNIDARKLRIELLRDLAIKDNCIMSRNALIYTIKQDKEILKSKGVSLK